MLLQEIKWSKSPRNRCLNVEEEHNFALVGLLSSFACRPRVRSRVLHPQRLFLIKYYNLESNFRFSEELT